MRQRIVILSGAKNPRILLAARNITLSLKILLLRPPNRNLQEDNQ